MIKKKCNECGTLYPLSYTGACKVDDENDWSTACEKHPDLNLGGASSCQMCESEQEIAKLKNKENVDQASQEVPSVKTFKYVDKATREAQITEGMQNSPDMLLGFQEQATVVAEQKDLTKEEAGRALRIAKKQSEKLEAMNTNREGNIKTSLMKKFKL